MTEENQTTHKRRVRYSGKYPKKFEEKYKELGISEKVYAFGEKIEQELKKRFEKIDANAEYNQMKVIAAMQKKRQDPVAAKALEYSVSALLGHEICR